MIPLTLNLLSPLQVCLWYSVFLLVLSLYTHFLRLKTYTHCRTNCAKQANISRTLSCRIMQETNIGSVLTRQLPLWLAEICNLTILPSLIYA